jgi:hypothetical protein
LWLTGLVRTNRRAKNWETARLKDDGLLSSFSPLLFCFDFFLPLFPLFASIVFAQAEPSIKLVFFYIINLLFIMILFYLLFFPPLISFHISLFYQFFPRGA